MALPCTPVPGTLTAVVKRKEIRMLSRAFALALVIIAGPAAAQERGYPAVPLLSSGTSIVGETIRYPTTGAAHVTAAIVTIAPGASTVVHKHGVPLFAYILDGELTVNYGQHGIRTYKQGQAFMEAMQVAHFGTNTGEQPVRILAVYMGAAGASDVIPVK
jgi:quercetin dioxygenase-like cupin family protein